MKWNSIIRSEIYASDTLYRRLFESAKDGFLILDAESGKIIDINPFLTELLGYSKNEIIEKPIWEIGSFKDIYKNKQKFLELQQEEYVRYDELPLLTSAGRKIYVEFVSNVYLAENQKVIQCSIRDITERKSKEDNLQKTHIATSDFLNILLNHMHAPIIVWDTSMTVIRFNRQFELMSGYDSADVIGKKIDFLFPKEKIAATLELLKNNLDAEHLEVTEIDILTKDKTIKTVLWNSSRILDEEGKNIIATISQDITIRRQSELALRKSESHFRTLVRTIPDLIWLKDANGVYLSCNQKFELYYGAKETDIIGKTDYDFNDRELADFFRENDRKAMEAGKPTSNEEWVSYADDGHRAFLDTIKTPIYDSDGTLLGVLGIGRDITERKLAAQVLQASEKRFRAIFDQAPIAIALLDFQGHPIVSNLRLSNMLGYTADELSEMKFTEFTYPEDIDMDLNQFTDLIAGKIRGYNMEKRFIHKNGNLIWANLYVTSLNENNGSPKEILGMVEDITERKRAEEALRKSESKLNALFASMSEMVVLHELVFDGDGKPVNYRITDCNDVFTTITGIARKTAVGRLSTEVYGAEDPPYLNKYSEVALNGEPYHFETYFQPMNKHFFISVVSPEKNRFATVTTDITESKQAEEALRKSEAIKNKIVSNIGDVVVIIDQNGINQYKSPNITKLFGWKADELVGESTWELVHPDDLNYVQQVFHTLLKEKDNTANLEFRYRCKDGSYKWIEFTGVNLIHDKDINGILGNYHDITKRKTAEKELIRKESDLKKAQQIAHLGSWYLDISTNNVTWTEELYKMYGFDPTQPVPPYTEHMKLFTPESWEILSTSLAETRETGIPYELELKTIKKDGANGWMWVRGEALKDINGKIIGLWGAAQDITQYKQTEEELLKAKEKAEENKQKYKAIADTSPLAIYISNGIQQVAEYINPSFHKLFGYEYEEVSEIALWWPLAYPDKEYRKKVSEQWNNNVAKAIQNKTDFEPMEVIVTCKDGSKKNVRWGFVSTGNENWAFGMDLTSYRTTEQELIAAKEKAEESEEKYRAMYNNAPLSYQSLDENGCFIDINPMWLKMLGYERDEVIGKWYGDFLHHDYVEHFRKNFPAFKKRGYVSDVQFKLRRKDNTYIYVSFEGCIGYTPEGKFKQTYCVFKDITEQKALENALIKSKEKAEESEEKYKLLHENAGVGIGYYNTEGKVISFNQLAAKNMNGNPEDFVGKSIFDLSPKPEADIYFNRIQKAIIATEPTVYEDFVQLPNDEKWFLSAYTKIADSHNKVYGVQIVSQDITTLKTTEIELQKAKEKAVESDRLKSAFLANMSHEIRTPMNGILGFTQLLREPDLSSEQKEAYIDIVHQSGQRMLNTVNDIVEISKIEAGIVTVNLKEIDVQLRLKELIRFFIPEATKKGLKLILENEVPKTVALISTDENKIDSIFTNLIKNAIKFTKAGEIKVGSIVHETMLEFYVKDTGIGIPAERQHAVFDRFTKADILDKDAIQGSGLGLSITKAYVEMLGGEIRVESKFNQGSTFFFTLPLNKQVQVEIGKKDNGNQDEKASQIKGLHIVIAEDDETSALYLQTILQSENNKIILTKNGIETVEACRNIPGIDLVLMDIQMPDLNGYEATRQIRQFNKNVIIIAQTAFGLFGDREKSIDAGCNDYIAKPIKKEQLRNLIKKYFGN